MAARRNRQSARQIAPPEARGIGDVARIADSPQLLYEKRGAFRDRQRFSGLHVVRGASLDLDEAQHIVVPADQVNFAVMARRAVITRDHLVAKTAQIEISVLFTALSDTLARSGASRRPALRRKSVQYAKGELSDSSGKHCYRVGRDVCPGCDERHTPPVEILLQQSNSIQAGLQNSAIISTLLTQS